MHCGFFFPIIIFVAIDGFDLVGAMRDNKDGNYCFAILSNQLVKT